jgi:hypothetical protein
VPDCFKASVIEQVDQIKEDEMGGSCSTHGGDEKCIQNFGWKPQGEETIQKT